MIISSSRRRRRSMTHQTMNIVRVPRKNTPPVILPASAPLLIPFEAEVGLAGVAVLLGVADELDPSDGVEDDFMLVWMVMVYWRVLTEELTSNICVVGIVCLVYFSFNISELLKECYETNPNVQVRPNRNHSICWNSLRKPSNRNKKYRSTSRKRNQTPHSALTHEHKASNNSHPNYSN